MLQGFTLLVFFIFTFHTLGLSLPDTLSYHVQHFTDEHGLPQNSINGIGVDDFGFVWLATEGGITRYDGRNFKVYDSRKLGLHSSRFKFIRYVQETKELYGMNGLYEKVLLSQGRPWHYDHTPGFMIKTPVNEIDDWFQNATGIPSEYGITGAPLFQIDGINGGNYIIGHDSVTYYDRNHRIQSQTAFLNDNFYQFFPLEQQLFHFDFTEKMKVISPSGEIKNFTLTGDIITDRKNLNNVKLYWNIGTTEVFMCVDRSFYQVKASPDRNELQTVLILEDFDFDQHNIYSAHYDQNNHRIFLGSKTNGLFVFSRQQFRTLRAGERKEEYLFYSHLPFKENEILTSQGYVFSNTGMEEIIPHIGKATESRRSMIHDSKGFIRTTAGWKELYKISPDARTIVYEKETPEAVSCMYEGLDNQLWLGTFNDGDGIYSYDEARDTYDHYPGIADEITCLLQTTPDTLLVGTFKSGVLRLHISSGQIDTMSGLADKSIRSFYWDQENNLWITTYDNGFFLYRNHSLTKFPLDKNKYLQSAHCILKDNQGYFWISTNHGLFQVKINQLLRYSADTTIQPQYIHHNKYEGFNTNEFNGGCQPCAIKTGDGYFSYPSMNGLVIFHPDDIRPELPDQKIIIDELMVDGTSRNPTDSIMVQHGFNQMKITIATAYFGNPYNLHMEYQIQHENTGISRWFPLENEAVFINALQSGTHKVNIRQANFTGVNGYEYVSVFITVPPYYYETWWFMGITALVITLLFWMFYRWQSNRIRTQNLQLHQKVDSQTLALQEYVTELERSESNLIKKTSLLEHLSAAISHDIKSPLSFTVHALKGLAETLTEEKHHLASITQTTHSSILRVYDYVDNLAKQTSSFVIQSKHKNGNVNLYHLVHERLEFFTPFAFKKRNKLINTIDPGCELHTNGELLIIVVHNLIDNAIKYNTNSTITISTHKKIDGLELKITDNGRGMEPWQVETINSGRAIDLPKSGLGLNIVQYLTTILQCQLTIHSQPGKGSVVTLLFPVQPTK